LTQKRPQTPRAITRRLWLSGAAIVAERGARAFWPVWTLAFATYAAMALGAFDRASLVTLQAVLAVLAVLGLVLIVRGVRRFRWPGMSEAIARIDDTTPDRPVAAMLDSQGTNLHDPAARALWQRHQARMAERAAKAAVTAPDPELAKSDPWALRLMAATVLVAALIFARGDIADSLDAVTGGDTPEFAAGPSFEAWAAPPAYTGKPVVYLSEIANGQPVTVPTGTEITVRIYGEDSAIGLAQSVAPPTALTQSADGIADARFLVTQSGEISLTRDTDTIITWPFVAEPDEVPEIALSRRSPANPMAVWRSNMPPATIMALSRHR